VASTEFLVELTALALSPIVTSVLVGTFNKAKNKLNEPDKINKQLIEINAKVDAFSASYLRGSERSKQFQTYLFESSDCSFTALSYQTGSIRHLAESVCNGNKEEALRLCDEADAQCKKGQDLKNKLILDQNNK
jgi:hypothetical protein